MASASLDCTVKVWDIQNEKAKMTYVLNDQPSCLEWNHNGELISCISKDKMMHIYDPRVHRQSIVTQTGHEGSKPQKMKWIGENGQIITVGNSSYAQGRQYSIFDMRYLSKGPLMTKKLDGSNQSF
jgi:WD40 repeat protein